VHDDDKMAAAATTAAAAAAKGHAMASLTARDLAMAFVCHQSMPSHSRHV